MQSLKSLTAYSMENVSRPILNKPSASFYKRPLPPKCISFTSKRGKEMFANSLIEGNLESYFPLASQFLTQNEPAYCGLGTLVMILNALEIDPQRQFKGPWRWYSQEMLDCCRSLPSIAESGISLIEFSCLARCNGLDVKVHSAPMSIDDFRKDVKAVSRSSNTFMALSYSRKSLGQTGDGHFSPVGGYSEKDDSLLLLDVARFKYPSYWTTIQDAYDAMLPIDKVTGQPRGYTLLSPSNPFDYNSYSPSLTTITLNKNNWKLFTQKINLALRSLKIEPSLNEFLDSVSEVINDKALHVVERRTNISNDLIETFIENFIKTPFFNNIPKSTSPLNALFLMALFDSKGPLNDSIPKNIKPIFNHLISSSSSSVSNLSSEMGVLQQQLTALGDCCKEESELSCSCSASNGKVCT